MSQPVIFFDLDGVLADFVRGAMKLHGREDIAYDDVVWGLEEQFGIEPAEFWRPMGREFWANLQPFPDGFSLLRTAEQNIGPERIGILTSPCDTEGCVEGKRDWVARHLPQYRKQLFVGSAKHLFAGPGKVLVDDHDPNCAKFRDAGGWAVTPPRPWNEGKGLCQTGGYFCVPYVWEHLNCAVKQSS